MGVGSSHVELTEMKEILKELYDHFIVCTIYGSYALIRKSIEIFKDLRKRFVKTSKTSSRPEKKTRSLPITNEKTGTKLSAQILALSDSKATEKFVPDLQDRLKKSYGICTSFTETLEKDEHIGFSIIICDSSATSETIACQFRDGKEELVESTMIIMIHAIRQSRLSLQHHNNKMHIEMFDRNIVIVEMGFTINDGIYDCPDNRRAFTVIKTFAEGNAPSQSIPFVTWESENTLKDTVNKAKNAGTNTNRNADSLGSEKAVFDIMIPDCSSSEAAAAFVAALHDTRGIKLQKVNDAYKSQSDRFLILLCNVTSRIEANIDACVCAINNKELKRRTILLLLHVGEKESSSENTKAALRDEKWKEYHAIIDIAFSIKKGIYDCKMNANALKELKNYYKCQI